MATNTLEWKLGLRNPGEWFVWRRVNGEVKYWADEEGTDRWSYDDAREVARMLNAQPQCGEDHPLIGGGPCNGDHRDGMHHNAEGFFWGPVNV